MTYFSINDLETFSGIKKHTIRIWEQRYAFLQPKRTEALRRQYTPEELNLLLTVARLNQDGMRVSQIARLIQERREANSGTESTLQLKAVHDLIIAMAEMDNAAFEVVLNQAVGRWGTNEVLTRIVVPFCERVGLFEKPTGKTYVENLLLVTEIIKRKLYCAIDTLHETAREGKTVLLFGGKQEGQELPMLYLHYLLKAGGYRVVNLGNGVAVDNMATIVRYKAPAFVVTPCPEKNHQRMELLLFAKELHKQKSGVKLLTIGEALPHTDGLSGYQHVDTVGRALAMLLHD